MTLHRAYKTAITLYSEKETIQCMRPWNTTLMLSGEPLRDVFMCGSDCLRILSAVKPQRKWSDRRGEVRNILIRKVIIAGRVRRIKTNESWLDIGAPVRRMVAIVYILAGWLEHEEERRNATSKQRGRGHPERIERNEAAISPWTRSSNHVLSCCEMNSIRFRIYWRTTAMPPWK